MSEGAYAEPGGEQHTDGWSGSPASHERALDEMRSGRAQRRRDDTIRALSIHGAAGLTWKELADTMGWHHGQASGVLSVLHKEGRISCLMDKRHKCHVYVMNSVVEGRETRPHGSTAAHKREQRLEDTHDSQVLAAKADGLMEGSRIGFDKGRHEGWVAGLEQGTAKGWQEGYDAAIGVVASIEAKAQHAHERGQAAGRDREAARQYTFIQELRRNLRKNKGSRAITHSATCWMENPSCMLDAVERNVRPPTPPKE
jgi:hypothetical protein